MKSCGRNPRVANPFLFFLSAFLSAAFLCALCDYAVNLLASPPNLKHLLTLMHGKRDRVFAPDVGA